MKKILIANRGEIAVRIVRTCKRLGIKTVSLYSSFDSASPLRNLSDETFPLDGQNPTETYLNIAQILQIAKQSGAEAIHPGYGFLSESAEFSAAVERAGLIFVGPNAESLRLSGNKDHARKLATSLGIPVPLGYDEPEQSLECLLAAAERIGTPLLVKAVAGGGGRGMRLVENKNELTSALESAASEAKKFFGDARLILEQYLEPVRHIEVQLVGDGMGQALHLFERDCSLQRRYQKLIEESPARNLDAAVRNAILDAAKRLALAVGLRGVATAEFLVGTSEFFFLEINPRIQVEHPVTEAVTGLDIVELQLRIASGEHLALNQGDIRLNGHAIEARVCGELPALGFRPCTGRISRLRIAEGEHLRADHALEEGMSTTGEYDSLLLKLISWGESAPDATQGLIDGLQNTSLGGLDTNIWFLEKLLKSSYYGGEKVPGTTFLDQHLSEFCAPSKETKEKLALRALSGHLAALFLDGGRGSLEVQIPPLRFRVAAAAFDTEWFFSVSGISLAESGILNFHCEGFGPQAYSTPGDQRLGSGEILSLLVGIGRGDRWYAESIQEVEHFEFAVRRAPSWERRADSGNGPEAVLAPLPGTVLSIFVQVGDTVSFGDLLLRIESMKMEHSVRATRAGEIAQVLVASGARVRAQEMLIVFANTAEG